MEQNNANKLKDIYDYMELVIPIIRSNLQCIEKAFRKQNNLKEKYVFAKAAECLVTDTVLDVFEMVQVYNKICKSDQINSTDDRYKDFTRIRNKIVVHRYENWINSSKELLWQQNKYKSVYDVFGLSFLVGRKLQRKIINQIRLNEIQGIHNYKLPINLLKSDQ